MSISLPFASQAEDKKYVVQDPKYQEARPSLAKKESGKAILRVDESLYSEPFEKERIRHRGKFDYQPVKKFLNMIKIGESTQLDILKLLSGPNVISNAYPSGREKWVYQSLWQYELRHPIENTLVKMNQPGRRLLKNQNPVKLVIIFDEADVVADYRVYLEKAQRN